MTDTPHEPWRSAGAPGGPPQGLDYELLSRLAQRSGWQVKTQVVSGRRCLVELEQGRADATVGLSHSAARAAYLRYPMRHGQLDMNRVLRWDSYSLYHRANAPVQWDGKLLRLAPGEVVETLQGHSVADDLRALGVPVREQGRSTEYALHRLLHGEISVAALQTSHVDSLRERLPAIQALVRAQPPLRQRPYFVVFSARFAKDHGAELPALWAAFDAAARFPAYQRAAQQLGAAGSALPEKR
ncbi:transporter substrate-binding domain-containing protein [Inhella sp.]|uniref:transporter substrate-binding domain-containing protein n=1 Tax=Inhella sp. TaxID=1921806 RepID=UPI0035B30116